MHKTILVLIFILGLQSCQVYQSPERKEFESESPNFRIQNLQKATCSRASQARLATASKLVLDNPSERVYEYIVSNKSVFESENLQGEYCVLSYNPE